MGKKIRVWDGTAWQDVAPSLPYTAIHSAQASMPATGVDGQVWLDTDGTLAGQDFVPLSGGTMTGNLNTPSINGGGISGFNNLVNGGFDFWQRGTSFSLTGSAFTADRFYLASTSSSSASRSTDVPINNYSNYSLSATSDQWVNGIFTLVENGANLVNGRTYTFSAWVKGPSGKSANISIGWQGEGTSYTFTGNWQYITRTITFSSSFRSTNGGGDSLYLHFVRNVLGGATQLVSGDTVLITQCKMEEGSQATPFTRHGITIPGELTACQRYFFRLGGKQGQTRIAVGSASSATAAFWIGSFPTEMRVAPGASIAGSPIWYDKVVGGTFSSYAMGNTSPQTYEFVATGGSGLTTGRAVGLTFDASTTYIDFSAEL
jgi:hypothetical protein